MHTEQESTRVALVGHLLPQLALVAVCCLPLSGMSRQGPPTDRDDATKGDRSVFSACKSGKMDHQAAEKWTSPQRGANKASSAEFEDASGLRWQPVQQCQALGPAAPYDIRGVDCSGSTNCRRLGWEAVRSIDWQRYAQGEYVGHERTAHIWEYRLRVDDELDFVYRLTRDEIPTPYQLNVGDEIRLESFTDPDLNRDMIIQPDGTITVRLLGQVRATGKTVAQITTDLEDAYKKYYKVPALTVSPLRVNSKLEDLRSAVDSRFGPGGQNRAARVTPEGTIQLPVIGSFFVQGLSISELQQEVNERYAAEVEGMEIIPVLVQRAPRYCFVVGMVQKPGRFEMTGPTTLMQAISMAGSWEIGAYLKQVVVFRRGDDWRLMATMVDIRPALFGRDPCPPAEIWLNDSDVVVVPKNPILVANIFIEMVFTRGIYGVFPLTSTMNFARHSSL